MVSRDEAEPASLMFVRGGGPVCRGGPGGTTVVCGGAGAFGVTVRELALVRRLGLGAVFFALALARGARVRAGAGFFGGFLEELTPELPDLAHRAGHGPERCRLHTFHPDFGWSNG
jgi:hypothetical protein